MSFLVAWEAKLEERDFDNKMTALHYAVISGTISIVRKLLLAGADKNSTDSENLTPLAHAKEKELDNIALILVRGGSGGACPEAVTA